MISFIILKLSDYQLYNCRFELSNRVIDYNIKYLEVDLLHSSMAK